MKSEIVKFKDLATIVAGQSPKSEHYSSKGGFPFLQGNRTFGHLYPTIDTYTNKITKTASKGEILMSVRAPVGALNFANQDLCIGRGLAAIQAKNGNNAFLFYNLKYNIQRLIQRSSGTTYDSVTKDQINDFDLVVPVKNQDKISDLLMNIDFKIELNNKKNAQLESMVKLIYDYWFVQFDFPDKNGNPYKSSGGKMVYDDKLKREIPVDFEVREIQDLITVKDGTHDSPKTVKNGFKLVTSKHLRKEGLDFENANCISKDDFINVNKRSKVHTGDILFSMIGKVGTVYKVEEEYIDFAIKNVALYKTSELTSHKNYIYLCLKGYDMARYMGNVIAGSIQKFIGLGSLRKMPLLINETLIYNFDLKTKPIFLEIENRRVENLELTKLRDWLLPMLMNGQVTIKD